MASPSWAMRTRAGGNGQRALGQYQTGGILALDASTNKVRWNNHTGLDMGHGQGPLSTASVCPVTYTLSSEMKNRTA